MNIKDIEEIINDLEVEYPTNDNFKIIYDYIRKVEKENKKLQQERDKYKSIVEKAIRFIEGWKKGWYSQTIQDDLDDLNELLEKLKELEEGNSNERNN